MSSSAKWALLALSLVGGCLDHTPLGPGADVVVVQAVLNPTRAVQHIEIRHSGIDFTEGVPVHGATVTVTAPDGITHVASEVGTQADPNRTLNFDARYDVTLGELTIGTPYHLRVVTADGAIAEGEAIVPITPPPQLMAERRFDPTRDTLRFVWPRTTGVRAYEVRIIPEKDSTGNPVFVTLDGHGYFVAQDFLAYVDTSVVIAGTARRDGMPVFLPGVRYDVIVSAVDSHYYEFFSHESDPYSATSLPSSLRGGFGVFGAIVPVVWQSIVVEGSVPGR